MRKIVLGIIILMTALITNAQNTEHEKEIKLYKLINQKEEKIFAHELFANMQIIKPKMSNESVIGRISSVKVYDNHLFINNEEDFLQVYDHDGKFIFKTSKGKGPYELLKLPDFTIDTDLNEVLALDGYRKRVVRFSFDGKKKGYFKLKNTAKSLAYVGDGHCCFYVPFNYYTHQGKNFDYIYIAHRSGKISDSLLIERTIESSPWITYMNFASNNGKVYFQPPHTNTLYAITNHTFKAAYRLNYGNYQLPFEFFASTNKAGKDFHKYLNIGSKMHTGDYLILGYLYDKLFRYALYKKKQSSFRVAEYDRTIEKNGDKKPKGIIFGSHDNFFYLKPRSAYDENKLTMIARPVDIIEYVSQYQKQGNPFYDDLMQSLKPIEEYDNPVIFIGTMK